MGQQARGSGCRKARKGKGKPRSEGEGPSRRTQRRNLKPERSAAAAGRQAAAAVPLSTRVKQRRWRAESRTMDATQGTRKLASRARALNAPLHSAASQRSTEQRGATAHWDWLPSAEAAHRTHIQVASSGVECRVEWRGTATRLKHWTGGQWFTGCWDAAAAETRAYDVVSSVM